jgi:hypothetical protein
LLIIVQSAASNARPTVISSTSASPSTIPSATTITTKTHQTVASGTDGDDQTPFVHSFYDARGKLRHVFRRKGHKQITIKGKPGTQEFMDAYHALLDQAGGLDVGGTRQGRNR